MAGEESGGQKFTGLAKYFNSYTIQGRANVTMATYALLALGGMYFYLKPKKTEPQQK